MPYFIYKISPGPTNLIRNLEKLEEHEQYKQAQEKVRKLRADEGAASNVTYKVIFAANALEAEERLQEHREAPILREWEK